MSFYTIFPDVLREPQKPANTYPLEEHGQNLASVLKHLADLHLADPINEALAQVSGNEGAYTVREIGGYLVTWLGGNGFGHNHEPPAFELAQQSAGTLRVLGILAALYQVPPRPLLAIEEPELYIHPRALGVLCEVLQEASLRSQVIITTHSPDLLTHLPVDAFRIVEQEQGSSKVGPLSDVQRDAIIDQLFSAGELMRMEGLRRAPAAVGE